MKHQLLKNSLKRQVFMVLQYTIFWKTILNIYNIVFSFVLCPLGIKYVADPHQSIVERFDLIVFLIFVLTSIFNFMLFVELVGLCWFYYLHISHFLFVSVKCVDFCMIHLYIMSKQTIKVGHIMCQDLQFVQILWMKAL